MIKKILFKMVMLGAVLPILNISCKKFITIDPPKTEIASSTVFENDLTATAAMTALYVEMSSASGTSQSITFLGGLSADESLNFVSTPDYLQLFENNMVATNSLVSNFWGTGFSEIYKANAIIEGLAKSEKVSASLKKQLEGEAKFCRAFCHFYLVNLFGGIPYIKTTDYRINTVVPRLPVAQVYQAIVDDLVDAKNMLAENYITTERIRVNKWAATALLSRVYLYNENWSAAESESSSIINNTAMYTLNNLDDIFLKNSSESIWQLLPLVPPNRNTNEGEIFILTSAPPNFSSLRNEFVAAFESGDNRKTKWVGSVTDGISTYYYPFKYKIQTGSSPLDEYSMVLRLAEQYLIRAEARGQQNNIAGSQADLNVIRNRAGLPNTSASDKASLLLAIERERRIELFSEWGHRWLDLKRTGRVGVVLSIIKSGWAGNDALFPIPQSELLINHNMTQNPGY